jgi:hypothetical protein
MLGNLAEALLTLCMVLLVPALIALMVVVARSLVKARTAQLQPVGADQTVPTDTPVGRTPAAVYVAVGVVAGAAGGFISLEAYFVGVILAVAGGFLLGRQASRHRWFALGGFLLGMGACAAGFLSPALTSHDPAVTYDASTIPFFVVSIVLGLCGVAMLVAATTSVLRRGAA